MRILIIEDFRPIAKGFSELFAALGHEVFWVTGFHDVRDLVAITPDGQSKTIVPGDFDIAFVDGEIEGGKDIDGVAVVARLVLDGLQCVGISTVADLNEKMRAAGAAVCAQKVVIFLAFVGESITPEQLLDGGEEAALAVLNVNLAELNSEENRPLRKKGDALIARYLKS